MVFALSATLGIDITLLVSFVGCLWLRKNVVFDFIIYGTLIVFLSVLILFLFKNEKSLLARVLSYFPLSELGNISLEFYLLHMPIIGLLLRIKPFCDNYIGNAEIVLLGFFVTWAIAVAVNNLRRDHKGNKDNDKILSNGC